MVHSSIDTADPEELVLAALVRRREARRTDAPPRPIRALALARLFRIRPGGSPDSRRRGVRQIVARLRSQGHPVLTAGDGYWLGVDAQDHQIYQQFRRRNGLAHLAASAEVARFPSMDEATGQLTLFGEKR
jgi:hypothetical protein